MHIIAAMIPWYSAVNVRQWAARTFCARNYVLLGVVLLCLSSEAYFGWIEVVVGSYLAATNSHRPEIGTVWQGNRKIVAARKRLESLAPNLSLADNQEKFSSGFAQIFREAAKGKGVMLPASSFINLYTKLPSQIAAELISAFELLQLQTGMKWARIFIESVPEGMVIYFLNEENLVLRKSFVRQSLLEVLVKGQALVDGRLESMSDFRKTIYAAEDFFAGLLQLPEKVRHKVVARPFELLTWGSKLERVGISSESTGSDVTLGFEIRTNGKFRVILLQADKTAVEKIRHILGKPERK